MPERPEIWPSCRAMAGKDQYQTPFDPVFGAANAQIEFGAAQGGDANAITLGGDLCCALRLASILQMVTQPFTGKLALRKACAGRAVGQHVLPG